jgi:hypothetical protein
LRKLANVATAFHRARHSREKRSQGASAEDCALDARFRGHDEKIRITDADFGNEVLDAKPDNMIVGRKSGSGVAAVSGAWAHGGGAFSV